MSLDLMLNLMQGEFSLEIEQQIPTDGVIAVYGPSGSGKTTLLRAIAGLLNSPKGRVTFNGKVWQNNASFLPVDKRGVAYVFQEPSLFEHLSVKANIDYAFKRTPDEHRRIDDAPGGEICCHLHSIPCLIAEAPQVPTGQR